MTPAHTGRTWRGALVRVGGSAAILAVLFYFLPLGELWPAMQRVPVLLWLGVLGAYLSLHVLAVVKWRLMVNLAEADLDFVRAAHCYFAGLFGNVFLPSIVGGDVVRAGLGLRFGRNKAGLLLGSLIDRMLDVAALAAVAGTGALLVPGTLDGRSRKIFWAVAAATLVGGALAALLGLALLRRRLTWRMRRRLVPLRRAWRSMRRKPLSVAAAMSMALIIQTGFAVLMAVLAAACGLHLALRVWIFAYPLAKLSAFAPLTQGGIGVREAVLVGLLRPFGAAAAITLAAGLVWETIVITGGLIGGGLALLTGRAPWVELRTASAENGAVAVNGVQANR